MYIHIYRHTRVGGCPDPTAEQLAQVRNVTTYY